MITLMNGKKKAGIALLVLGLTLTWAKSSSTAPCRGGACPPEAILSATAPLTVPIEAFELKES